MKKLSYKKNRNRLWIAAAGVLLALLHVWVRNTTFSINCNHAHYYPDLYDFLNYILVGNDDYARTTCPIRVNNYRRLQ